MSQYNKNYDTTNYLIEVGQSAAIPKFDRDRQPILTAPQFPERLKSAKLH